MKALWSPTPAQRRESALDRFRRQLAQPDYAHLHRFSIDSRTEFWAALWDFVGIVGERGNEVARGLDEMPGTRWFPEAQLNFAENLLQRRDDGAALIYRDEHGHRASISRHELARRVASIAAHLSDAGITSGDRVAAVAPNGIDTVVAMLATTTLGGVWSSCSPDFGAQAIVDRFAQIEPKVLVGCDGYFHGGKWFDCAARLRDVAQRLPSVSQILLMQSDAPAGAARSGATERPFNTLLNHPTPHTSFVRGPFAAPLYILFSSGTTGAPKCIVHSVGGTLLQHRKEQLLHCDFGKDERVLFYTTCGWMMWNWLISALAGGSTVCLYDGSPFHPDAGVLMRYVEEERISHLGISPGYLSTLAKQHYEPRAHHDLSSLRSLLSTGSPLPADSHVWAYEHIAPVRLSSITGGTDIIGCFALGNPTLPVYAGEIQSAGLGMALEFWDDAGAPLSRGKGELVCTRSFVSMPIGFWNDPHGANYSTAYFERFPGAWHHGDFGEFTEHDGVIIHGRSDAVLNRGGVRIGTAEIYRQLESIDEVLECIAVSRERTQSSIIVLFVRLKPTVALDPALTQRIKHAIREGTSPRHVPDAIVAVPDIPRTRSGKLVELAVRDVINGRQVKNSGALANPQALDFFNRWAQSNA